MGKLRDDHKGINALLADLEQVLRQTTPAQARPAPANVDRSLLGPRLDRLIAELEQHFRFEEAGFMVDVSNQRPTLEDRVRKLQGQHGPMLQAFTAAAAALEVGARCDEVAPGLLQAIGALRRHEHEEIALLQDAMLLDLGAGD